jgi:hypothetical protein
MDSLKRILKSAMDDRSPRFMLATIALGVVVALLAGTLIGYKLDNKRGGSSATKVTKTTKKKKKPVKKGNAGAVAAPVLYGTVTSARPAKIVVVGGADNKRVPLVIGAQTRAELAEPSSASSIVVRSKVIYAPSSSGSTTAAEVVVLPATAGLGAVVTAVSPSSMTLGGSLVVNIQGANVEKTTPANRARIPSGSKVAVAYFTLRGKNGAVEVVVLPASTKL